MTSTNVKSKRMPQFDLLRIVAILIIFNYHFCNEIGAHQSVFYEYKNGGWGSVGTCIFFILSGYMIHMTCVSSDMKSYFKKRFLSIFPPLWISFVIAYLITSLQQSNFLWGGNPLKLVLSFAGFDTYAVLYGLLTYACVGEWFTGMIIFLYVAYLLLRVLIKKAPVVTTIVLAVLYFAESMFAIQPIVPPDSSVFTGLALFWFGMLIQEHPDLLKFSYIKVFVAVAAAALVLFVPLPVVGNVLPWKNLLGIALFYLLINDFAYIPYGDNGKEVLKYFSNISFIIYLTHHFVIFKVMELLPTKPMLTKYMVSLAVTVVVSILISKVCNKIKK